MPLDRHAARFLAMFGAAGQGSAYNGPTDRRRALEDLARIADYDRCDVARIDAIRVPGGGGMLNARAYTPLDAEPGLLAGLVYFHGGGWVAGDLDTHDGVCRRLANASGCKVIAIDYRRAPEHPFPAAYDDAWAAALHISVNAGAYGLDDTRLGVAGDSAGAGLAAAVCQTAARASGPRFALQLLMCPILDLSREAPSRKAFADGYFLDRASMEKDLAFYLAGHADLADPRLSPLLIADVANLPPAIIHTAEYDPFRDEGEAYAERLGASSHRHPGMIHYFYAMPRTIPYALKAAEMIGAQVRDAMVQPALRRTA
ncbi:MAG TPA: alpha/beta hydrolase [Caulobacteraceae bacterium]|jgi:acetyl esterase/lipase|nr:alpha/beta hydrolase [Caulobacteraceae bacterium]